MKKVSSLVIAFLVTIPLLLPLVAVAGDVSFMSLDPTSPEVFNASITSPKYGTSRSNDSLLINSFSPSVSSWKTTSDSFPYTYYYGASLNTSVSTGETLVLNFNVNSHRYGTYTVRVGVYDSSVGSGSASSYLLDCSFNVNGTHVTALDGGSGSSGWSSTSGTYPLSFRLPSFSRSNSGSTLYLTVMVTWPAYSGLNPNLPVTYVFQSVNYEILSVADSSANVSSQILDALNEYFTYQEAADVTIIQHIDSASSAFASAISSMSSSLGDLITAVNSSVKSGFSTVGSWLDSFNRDWLLFSSQVRQGLIIIDGKLAVIAERLSGTNPEPSVNGSDVPQGPDESSALNGADNSTSTLQSNMSSVTDTISGISNMSASFSTLFDSVLGSLNWTSVLILALTLGLGAVLLGKVLL